MTPSIKKKGLPRPNMSPKVKAKKRAAESEDDDIGKFHRRGDSRRDRADRDNGSDDDESKEKIVGNATAKKSSRKDSNDDGERSTSSLSSTPIMALKRAKKTKGKGSNKAKAASKAKGDNGKTRKSDKTAPTATKAAATKKKTKKEDTSAKKTAVVKASTKSSYKDKQPKSDDSSSTSSEEEEAACCLCFCGVDCSDRALFFPKDRKQELEEDEDYYFSMDDPYLDEKLYDRNNALVYCDSCNRLFHQKCHFVPLLVIPRGDWNCLICSIQQQQKSAKASTPKSIENNNKRKRSTGKSTEKKKDPEMPIHDEAEWKKFLNRKTTDMLFQTPPRREELAANGNSDQLDFVSLQKEWELASAIYKAQMWHRQLKQLKTFLSSQASNIRMTNTALHTLTSTKRNRQHFFGKGAKSQELAQTIVRQTGAKFKIRDALLSLERIRTRDEPVNFSCLMPWCQEHPNHASHVFPFGGKLWQEERRIVPRTKERELAKLKGDLDDEGVAINKTKDETSVPKEIHLGQGKETTNPMSKKDTSKGKNSNSSDLKKRKDPSAKAKKDDNCSDDDSGISLDELQCCVCMLGDSTDENDVVLCDGELCHRAFHMRCVYPALTEEEMEDEDADWFCPLCSGVSNLMGEMHDLCIGSEDVDYDADNDSLGSWDKVQDVFPTSQWEYETAAKLVKGKRNGDTQRLLALYLGEDIEDKPEQMPIGSDSEDENDYSLFDDDSFAERKRKDREEGSEADDDSSRSSQATLVEMSSVEYNVGKDELAALRGDGGSNDSDEDSNDDSSDESSTGRMRKSRRLKRAGGEEGDSGSGDFGADFSESNILEGKRQRKRVDYRKLNDALFGDLDDKQKSQIDDKDDFQIKFAKKKEDEDDGSDSGSDDSNDSSSNEEGSSKSEDSEKGSEDENEEEESGNES